MVKCTEWKFQFIYFGKQKKKIRNMDEQKIMKRMKEKKIEKNIQLTGNLVFHFRI